MIGSEELILLLCVLCALCGLTGPQPRRAPRTQRTFSYSLLLLGTAWEGWSVGANREFQTAIKRQRHRGQSVCGIIDEL